MRKHIDQRSSTQKQGKLYARYDFSEKYRYLLGAKGQLLSVTLHKKTYAEAKNNQKITVKLEK